jgi:uncharacterized phage protein (TIGR01671 family)
MNREIKFRIWCKGVSTNANFNKPCWIQPTDFILLKYYRCFQDVIESDDFVVQQYTGLKDKNGKDIYEGDLVQYNQNSNYDGMNFEVIWSDVSFGWVLKSKTGDYLTNQITPNGPRYNFLEVVGNIFETKKDNNNE